jgi:outer membrane protein insertion porin family
VLAIAALLAFVEPAFAQRGAPAQAGGTITAVQIQGNVRAEPETIRSYLQLKEGQAYDPAAADRSLKALFATGLFSDVVIDMQGSTMVVRVTRIRSSIGWCSRAIARSTTTSCATRSSPSRDRSSPAPACSPTSSACSASIAAAAATNATIEPKIIRLEQGRVDLVFEIDEGDVTGIKRISFVGNEHFSDGTLRGKIARPRARGGASCRPTTGSIPTD